MADIKVFQGGQRRNTTLPTGANDALVLETWLRAHRSELTREAYRADITDLFDFTANKLVQKLTLVDLFDFEGHLTQEGKRPTSIARKLSAVKSLLTSCY